MSKIILRLDAREELTVMVPVWGLGCMASAGFTG